MLRITNKQTRWAAAAMVAAIAASLVLGGCSGKEQSASAPGSTTRPTVASAKKGGAQLWADNCSRCHNVPPPERYSDDQWRAIVHHMRLRADLTGEEEREITKFLQASN